MEKKSDAKRGVFYTHGTDNSGRRFTIAAKKINENTVQFGLAICNERDNFCRKIGRKIAEGRAVARPVQVLEMVDTPTEGDERKIVMDSMFNLKENVTKDVESFFIRNQVKD